MQAAIYKATEEELEADERRRASIIHNKSEDSSFHTVGSLLIVLGVIIIFALSSFIIYLFLNPSGLKKTEHYVSDMIASNSASAYSSTDNGKNGIKESQPVNVTLSSLSNPTYKHPIIKAMQQRGTFNAQQIANAVIIIEESIKVNEDPRLAVAIAIHRSNLDSQMSNVSGTGLFKIDEKKGKTLSRITRIPWEGETTLKDPNYNTQMELEYIKILSENFDGDMDAIISSHYMSPKEYKKYYMNSTEILPEGIAANLKSITKLYNMLGKIEQ